MVISITLTFSAQMSLLFGNFLTFLGYACKLLGTTLVFSTKFLVQVLCSTDN